jgi:hypothetical protein
MGCFYPRTQSHETPDNDAERRRAQARERKKNGRNTGHHALNSQINKQSPLRGLRQSNKFVALTPVSDPALQ